jgi:diaminohydroxyphosphoribosylaminopyrimidine deaminase/5-amino-6-(5-phosphoribosylamino)uracil reductase
MVVLCLLTMEKIIGEGFHQQYGGPHAELNCINSVREQDKDQISSSVLYVSLEPCSHFGKRHLATDLIITNKIPRLLLVVVILLKKLMERELKNLKLQG